METISECIRKYVEAHDNEVTSCEVVNYILKEKKFETTEKNVRATLTRILKEVGGKLKPQSSVTAEIRSYVKAHNNEVTSCEVINYILEEKKFKTTEMHIRPILTRILKEVGGKLKPKSSVKAEIRSYVKAHNNEVTSCEVINYILEERQFTANEKSIRDQLTRVLKEVGGKLKPQSSVTAEIRSYVKAHNNEVTSCEVINYILEEKKFETTEMHIRSTLTRILKEVGGKLKPYSKNNCNK